MPVTHPPKTTAVPTARAKLPLPAILAIWALWGVWSSQQGSLAAMLSGQTPPARAIPWQLTMVSAGFWALGTLAVIWIARLIRDRIAPGYATVLAHLGAFALLHVTDVMAYRLAADLFATGQRPMLAQLFGMVTFNALAYTSVVFIVTSLDSAQALRARTVRESQLETQLALAQFHSLRSRLHPHFLFNALNSITELIHSDPVRADRMLVRISELLRVAVDAAATPEVALRDELEFTVRYLDIERMRYGERLAVRIDVADDILDALVPNMLLQPLIENAVRHGVAPYAHPGSVELRVGRRGGELDIVVRDSGAGFDPDVAPGVGLGATRERLEKLFGVEDRLTFACVADGFETRVRLPLKRCSQVAA
jgi:two-component system, LytTR family, sensor kinase